MALPRGPLNPDWGSIASGDNPAGFLDTPYFTPPVVRTIPTTAEAPPAIVPTVQGVEVKAPPSNADKMRAILDAIYPTDAAPEMKYGTPLDIKIPFTKRRIKASGQTMDRLASAIAAAAQGMNVSPNDPGGQLLRGLVQGYGEARGADYATRKAAYEQKKEAYQKNLEARRKLAGTLGVEQFKQEIKPKEAGPVGKIVLTKELAEQARKNGIAVPEGLVGELISPGEIIRLIPQDSGKDQRLNNVVRAMNLAEANRWRESPEYKTYSQVRTWSRNLSDFEKNPSKISDNAIVMLLGKALDPNSVVRESEVALWSEASTFRDALQKKMSGLFGMGKKFSDDDRTRAIKLLRDIQNASRNTFLNEMSNRRLTMSSQELDPSVINDIGELAQPAQSPRSSSAVSDPNL